GTPASNSAGSTPGAPSAYTLDGPPERMIAAGLLASTCDAEHVCGTISEYTFASRTRRAMSWAYCAPKSTTRTGPMPSFGAVALGRPAALPSTVALGSAGTFGWVSVTRGV